MKRYLLVIMGSMITCLSLAQSSFDSLDINNVNARLNANGDLFWDGSNSRFEVPKGSGIMSIFAANIWVGGLNFSQSDSIYLAAMQYGQSGRDYWPGPIMDSIHYPAQAAQWNRVWKLNRSDIASHISDWSQQNYVVPQTILDWPAHGDTQFGQAANLAPFHDNNNNNLYDPQNGDYPIIKGDQAVYFIINDDKEVHSETGAQKMKIELHCMAYAMDCINDSALYNTIFLNYRIINRSNLQYEKTNFGTWVDFDLGCYNDDYVGCDVERGTFFVYNGNAIDNSCQAGYGTNPPSQGVVVLAGPHQDSDGQDNPIGIGPDEYLNGMGYGDNIADNERMGLWAFRYHENNSSVTGDPQIGLHYYNYMTGRWKDGTDMLYDGNGHISGGGNPNVLARYMFPDDTDPLGWGTGGVPQAPWTETTASNNPRDVRGIGSTGSFTFAPGQVEEVDLAFVFGKAYAGGVDSSVQVMKSYVDDIRMMFFNDSTPCGQGLFSGIKPQSPIERTEVVTVYPNPADDALYISGSYSLPATMHLYDIAGHRVKEVLLLNHSQLIDLSQLSGGLYLYRVLTGEGTTATGKLVIR